MMTMLTIMELVVNTGVLGEIVFVAWNKRRSTIWLKE